MGRSLRRDVHIARTLIDPGEPPVRFDRWQHAALYGPDGFYNTGGAAGIGGDFVTSVEAGTSFADAVGVELDRVWTDLGYPDPFVVVEGGAGVGTLALNVLTADLACHSAMRWVMVEISEAQRTAALARLAFEAFGTAEDLPAAAVGDLRNVKVSGGVHVVIANELLDNLAVRVVRRISQTRFDELWIAADGSELWRPLESDDLRRASHHGRDVSPGAEFPLADKAVAWVWRALQLIEAGGRIIIADYGGSTVELSARPERGWLRTYRRHQRGGMGTKWGEAADITSDVPFDQLPGHPALSTQADWLVERLPHLAESQSFDDRALLDGSGMGGFIIATWT